MRSGGAAGEGEQTAQGRTRDHSGEGLNRSCPPSVFVSLVQRGCEDLGGSVRLLWTPLPPRQPSACSLSETGFCCFGNHLSPCHGPAPPRRLPRWRLETVALHIQPSPPLPLFPALVCGGTVASGSGPQILCVEMSQVLLPKQRSNQWPCVHRGLLPPDADPEL